MAEGAARGVSDGGGRSVAGPRRILLVLGSSAGGVGTHVRSIAREFTGAGHQVIIAGPEAANEQFGFDEIAGYRQLEVPARLSFADRAGVTRLRAIIDDERPDVVHAHGFRAGLLAVLAVARTPDRPLLVTTWHNAVLGGGVRAGVLGLVERFIARRADVTLGASRDLVERAGRLGAADARLAPVAAPGRVIAAAGTDGSAGQDVSAGAAEPAGPALGTVRANLLAELGADDDAAIVLTVGRVAPQKNFGLLIDAAALLGESPQAGERPTRFVIAGGADAGELATLEQRIDKLRLPVDFLGPRDDVAALYGAADVFLLTSRWEARALVVQEAMAAGLPIVATAVGGLPELIGDAGVLIEPGPDAARDVAETLRALLSDAVRRRELGSRARERAAEFPDEAEAAAQILAVYADAVRR